ncbi:hypothetical protein VXC91_41405 [Streptomyces chiangmaiensis]|uniref:Uncharacterized protein n=2 Tax=Streptomyces chiangmaiensis TaxID=766497 RepID=A0ABU7FVM6_9ACTN|nr:hypothetical protein [Streptomyces chiangmaiensis]
MQSCQHAMHLGKFAGHNVAADVLGLDLAPFVPKAHVTCLDLGPAGEVVTTGWERTVQKTGEQSMSLKCQINSEWIYPSVDDADAILEHADCGGTWSMKAFLA